MLAFGVAIPLIGVLFEPFGTRVFWKLVVALVGSTIISAWLLHKYQWYRHVVRELEVRDGMAVVSVRGKDGEVQSKHEVSLQACELKTGAAHLHASRRIPILWRGHAAVMVVEEQRITLAILRQRDELDAYVRRISAGLSGVRRSEFDEPLTGRCNARLGASHGM
jgi:hypothetical protein